MDPSAKWELVFCSDRKSFNERANSLERQRRTSFFPFVNKAWDGCNVYFFGYRVFVTSTYESNSNHEPIYLRRWRTTATKRLAFAGSITKARLDWRWGSIRRAKAEENIGEKQGSCWQGAYFSGVKSRLISCFWLLRFCGCGNRADFPLIEQVATYCELRRWHLRRKLASSASVLRVMLYPQDLVITPRFQTHPWNYEEQ